MKQNWIRRILTLTVTLSLAGGLTFGLAPETLAAGSSWISLTEVQIRNWTMLGGKSTDSNPTYSPGINRMKTENGVASGNAIVINGKYYEYGIASYVTAPGEKGWTVLEYDVSSLGYDTFGTTVGKCYASGGLNANARFYVYVDGECVAESPVLSCRDDHYFEVDISRAKTLSLVADDGGDGHSQDEVAWGNPVLFNKADAVITDISLAGSSVIIPLGGEIDLATAEGHITYDNGGVKEVPVSEIEITPFDNSVEGTVDVTLTYDGVSHVQQYHVVAPERYEYLTDIPYESFLLLDDRVPLMNTIEDKVTPANAGGVYYSHGFWMHPTSNAADNGYSEVVWNIGDYGYTKFHATVGKPNDTYMYSGQYHVYLDGVLLESSEVLYAGQTHTFDLDIAGGQVLTLAVTGGETDSSFYYWDSTEWVDPVVWVDASVKAPIQFDPPTSLLWSVAGGFVVLMFASVGVYTHAIKKKKTETTTEE